MTVDPRLLEQYLPDDPQREIRVILPNGLNGMVVVRREAVELAKAEMACGIVNKRGFLRHILLLVPLGAAMKVVCRFRRPPVKNDMSITRTIQATLHWKPCFDRAKLGQSASVETVHFRSPQPRYW